MRITRHLWSYAILLCYTAQVLGGAALHLLQSAGEQDACCGSAHTLASNDETSGCTDCDAGSHAEAAHQPDSSANCGASHDPSHCEVCQALGQAQVRIASVEIFSCGKVAPACMPALPEFVPAPSRCGFLSRAPPVA